MIPADIKVNTEDICICLGNLLDNAIEASKKIKEERRSMELFRK
ncbi:MAG: ATP-binding protein [Lachnospiraceae bacterium]|nr:ATP-binding protein [Lachnospiraceae bacterium]